MQPQRAPKKVGTMSDAVASHLIGFGCGDLQRSAMRQLLPLRHLQELDVQWVLALVKAAGLMHPD